MMLLVIVLLTLHGPDGREISVNVDEITTLRGKDADNKHFTPGANCLVNLTDGKFVAVKEDCSEVRRKAEEVK